MKLPFIVDNSYQAERLLGEGANAWVFDSLVMKSKGQLQEGQRIALKLFKAEQAGEVFKTRFNREVNLGRHLSHQNLVTIYDVGIHENDFFSLPYFVMDLVEGITLETLIKNSYNNRYVESYVLSIFQDILSALDSIHAQNFLHRDIHPGNIMVNKEGRAILMDYGLVASTNEAAMTPEWEIVGARRYLAPECLWDLEKSRTTASDLYSLASTLYHLATGKLVHHHKIRYADYFHALLNDKVILPSNHNSAISPWLSLLLTGLLSANPDERIQKADVVLRIVKALSENRIVTITFDRKNSLQWWIPGAGYDRSKGLWTWRQHGHGLDTPLLWENYDECLEFLNSGYGDTCVSLQMPDCKKIMVSSSS